jgi:uncharacterized protein GlcG (DUF336 family)
MSIRPGAPSAFAIEPLEPRALLATLSLADVELILAQAASQANNRQVIAVSDRDGDILGIFEVGNAPNRMITKAVTRARTAALFQSTQNAFTTRTARFIIQDHFPHPVPNTPGGPLYGVEFSSLAGSDVFDGPAISGDPGGIPLFKDGQPVGGIGVAGDGRDVSARQDFLDIPLSRVDNPGLRFYNGSEENDFDERVALAGASGFMAPRDIRADQIFLDGLRLPFIKDRPATGKPNQTLDELISSGAGALVRGGFVEGDLVHGSSGSPFKPRTLGGSPGELKNTNPAASGNNQFGFVPGNDPGGVNLNVTEVIRITENAVRQALKTRGAIRQPIGVNAQVHIAVVDRTGDILGVFKMADGTNFSYDVAVQKARTAAFFSDNTHAFSTRAVGFVSQRFFPAGIDGGFTGPFFTLQNELSSGANLKAPLANGITIFPGGVPLYKKGVLVGAVGVSGDGVNEDDTISYAGTQTFRPPDPGIRSDHLDEADAVGFLTRRFNAIRTSFTLSNDLVDDVLDRLALGLDDVQLPYVKFPRNPDV